MHKILLLSIVCASILLGGERIEIIASQVDANGSIVHSTSHPTIVYQDQILSAETMTYDRNSSVVEAFGHVNAFKAGQYHVISDYSRLNLNEDTRYLKPYYALDTTSGVWMSTDEATGCQNNIDLASGMVSGCNSTDPLWTIHFSSADYNTEKMWVNIYNALLYIDDVPVMYFPYFGYPTDKTRRSGLLIPTFGVSSTEGFFYQQPIYFAPKNWWDLELRPQIRTMRGAGMYGDFRFVDSLHSKGSVRMGYFKEQSDYAQKHDLAYEKHYGYNVDYHNSAFLNEWFGLNLEGESGLYVHAGRMSDVDYLNLQHSDQVNNVTANQVLSRVNSYYSNEDNYFGAYVKYYQYLNQASNAQTIQTLPSLQYHRYLENFLGDHLLASGDVQASNYYRTDGKRAVQTDINIPVTLQTSLFDEYLDLSYTANAATRAIGFYGNTLTNTTDKESDYPSGYYAQLDHTLSLGATLVRPYETITHVISPNISYRKAGTRLYNGYYEDRHGQCSSANYPCEFYTLNEPSDGLSLGLNNFLFEDGKQWLVDRLSQTFSYDDTGSYYGELQNELEWEITKAISYYNQTSYNHDRNRVTKEQNTLRYNDSIISGSVSNYYTDQLGKIPQYASYWTADAAYQYDRYTKIFGLIAYDYHEALLKRSEIGFLYAQRCLDFGLKFVQNRRPILTNTAGSDSVNDSYVFITVILKPLGGSEFNYKLTKN
ncbi:MAG: LPS assembly protein LptD [Campylobacterales bacterium]|nr:LPS assembly protein LptD [Campylobacterales bacterium]